MQECVLPLLVLLLLLLVLMARWWRRWLMLMRTSMLMRSLAVMGEKVVHLRGLEEGCEHNTCHDDESS